jgi:hypothetical protein
MTYNEVLERVEKDLLAAELGGDMPLNPQFHQLIIQPYLTVGEILENFFQKKGAAKDPRYQYIRDPFWIQFQQLALNKAQMTMQNQMQSQQMQAQQQAAQNGEAPPEEEQAPEGASDTEKAEIAKNNLKKREIWMANNYLLLEKSIKDNHNELSTMILARHKELVNAHLKKWKQDSQEALNTLVGALKPEE